MDDSDGTTKDSVSFQSETMRQNNSSTNGNDKREGTGGYSMNKSRITNFTLDTLQTNADLPIDRLDENHYVYRRGSTEVHVQTYAESAASDIIDEEETNSVFPRVITFISSVLGLIFVVITLVIKLAAAISLQLTKRTETQYMMVLYIAGFVWLTYYNFKGMCRHKNQVQFMKSNRSSNRWLKGVLVLFGLAIVLKDGLEFMSYLMVDTFICTKNQLEATSSFFHALFILSQVTYLFRYSKAYIRKHNSGSSTGIMAIMAINLSSWIAAIVDETLLALSEDNLDNEAETVEYEDYVSPTNSSSFFAYETSGVEESEDYCTCHTAFCSTVHTAETFLFPFLIEFSLVASSMLYITWENIGKTPPQCEDVIKPSYKFYSRYVGALFGGIAFFATIIVMILLGTFDSSASDLDYFTESSQLVMYDAFVMGLQFAMLLAIAAGFYLFYLIPRPLEHASMLDQALLVICILGPLVVHMFSMVAVIVGSDNKTVMWIFTLLHPLIDVIQSVAQLLFILYGLKREPITSANAKETAAQLSFGIEQQMKLCASSLDSSDGPGETNKAYLRTRRSSITSVVSRLANLNPMPDLQLHSQSLSHEKRVVNSDNDRKDLLGSKTQDTSFSAPEITISGIDDDNEEEDKTNNGEDSIVPKSHTNKDGGPPPHHSIVKIVSETKVARPDQRRTWLRDVIFFLLMANACLWVFQSLDGTAFTVYQYESLFYGSSAWTTIKMICRPLSIFFRMHSAGSLFEMWSYA